MADSNISQPFSRWEQANATTTKQIGTNGQRIILKGIIVNSHTTSTFRLGSGTLTSYTPIAGSYTPAAGSSSIDLKEIDFQSGLVVVIAGTADYTVVYNTLP